MNPDSLSRPVVWSVAGMDTSGGAGLSADQRAADAMGVHLCPVVATLTAQNSCGIDALQTVQADWLDRQFDALARDLRPTVIKTGMLGSVEAVRAVAARVDRLRADTPSGLDPHAHLALVVDPVCRASAGGASPDRDALVQAQREFLLPRATVVTPNRQEAAALMGRPHQIDPADADAVIGLARGLQDLGARAVVVTGGDSVDPRHRHWSLDWLQTPQASGWLVAPRVATRHHHGTGCTHATGMAAALALGHVAADAAVLASMLTRHALMNAQAAGEGAGPVSARRGFAAGPARGGAPLPWLGLHEALPWALSATAGQPLFRPFEAPADRLYGITSQVGRIESWLAAGLQCMQWRHKSDDGVADLLPGLMQAASRRGASLFINDHWQATLACLQTQRLPDGWVPGLHLGQEDLLALDRHGRDALREAAPRLMLGLSSHTPWELARAAGCAPSLLACGPVQATTTKRMPWRPQGRHNLGWWVANSPCPVVGIGGLLEPRDLRRFSDIGCAAWCLVRGLEVPDGQLRARLGELRRAAALPATGAALTSIAVKRGRRRAGSIHSDTTRRS